MSIILEKTEYIPKEYWESRLARDFTLEGSGFDSFGKNFNRWQYRMTKRNLIRAVKGLGISLQNRRVLDIGCGTGFYVDVWCQQGIERLVGLDITDVSIRELTRRYPGYRFYQGDISSLSLVGRNDLYKESFDIVTAFAVLFHIVDDNAFGRAVENIASLCSRNGLILITDTFPHKHPYLLEHQKSRTLSDYVEVLLRNRIKVVARVPMHWLLGAPLDISIGFLRRVAMALWVCAGGLDRVTCLVAPLIFGADLVLTRVFRESPSSELLICSK